MILARIGCRKSFFQNPVEQSIVSWRNPLDWGADAIYDIVDGKLEFRGYFKMPAPQVKQENCVAHNGSIVPVSGRDIFVQAWYQGGSSVGR